LKILLIFDQIVEYKRPHWRISLARFHKMSKNFMSFQDALAVKVSLDLFKGLWSYFSFNLTGSGYT